MALNTQFSIAVHLLAGLGYFGRRDLTSTDLAASVNTSASFVRRVLAKLSRAGLVETATGKAGACWLARNPADISLLEIHRAVEAPKPFAIHRYPVKKGCPVSTRIKPALQTVSTRIEASLEAGLHKITLSEVIADLRRK